MECSQGIDIASLEDELFNKQFTYKNCSSQPWSLDVDSSEKQDVSCEIEHLSSLKQTLNSVKSSLNDFDILKWSSHTNFTNPSSKILPHLRKSIHPELATQAWCKFYELLSYGDVIPKNVKPCLCSVHLCEAPGGFICALNHHLRSTQRNSFSHFWVANTLNPYYEGNALDSCIVDDRLISRTLKSWCFGKDNTGDIFDGDFLTALQAKCFRTFHERRVNIVTADGSLNCQDDPSEQEAIVAPLHYSELLCALNVLSAQGNLVIKMFTLFESHSITFMYILCCLFDKVSVIKPSTSKAGNSEVYVIAHNFCGIENCSDFLGTLKKHFPFKNFIKNGTSLIPVQHIPKSFLTQHLECVDFFTKQQISTIQTNIHFYHNMTDEYKADIKELQANITQKFFDVCDLKKVPSQQCIVPSGVLRSHVKSNIKLRPRLEGSFTQRKASDNDTEMQVSENDHGASCWVSSELVWLPRMRKTFWWDTTQAVLGKPLQDLHSSLFCTTDVIMQYEQAYEQVTVKNTELGEGNYNFAIILGQPIEVTEALSALISCVNGNVTVVKMVDSDPFYSKWMHDTIISCNSSLNCTEISLFNSNTYLKLTHKIDMVCINFALSGLNAPKWPELNIRCNLVRCVYFACQSLNKSALAMILLPSIVTRLSAQIMWVFSQCFEESFFYPMQPSNLNSLPAVLFVGKRFNLLDNYLPSLKHLCDLIAHPSFELLELFPITALLHTNNAAPFIETIRNVNEKCLTESTHVFNKRLLESSK